MKHAEKTLPTAPEELEELALSLYKTLHKKELEAASYKNEAASYKNEAASYKSKYESLLEQIRLARQQRFAPSSEKNSFQKDLFDEAGAEMPSHETSQEKKRDNVDVAAHTRGKKPKRTQLPKDLPREIIEYDIDEKHKICGCGQHLVRIGEEVTEQLKYIPAKLSVVCHVRPKYACKPCQENVKLAPIPVLLLPKSIATPELVSHIIISKYCDHLPLYRQEKMWQRIAIDLPRSSLSSWILKTAELCAPLIKLLQKNIVSHDYAQADETTVQVFGEKDRKNTSKSYMWCYRGGRDTPNIVYEYQETRSGFNAENFLHGFAGYLQTDAYAGYNWAQKDKQIDSVGCNAHARRNFAVLAKLSESPRLAKDGIKFYRKLYRIEAQARENKLTAAQRHKLRCEQSQPILASFKQWLDKNLTKTPEKSQIGKAIRYAIRHWPQLTCFLKDGRIEIDNNLIENAIRPFAIGRKNWLFMGSPSGAKAGAAFYSLIETCKANNINPQKYLCTMLHKIRLCKCEDDYRKLLPQNIQLD